jgi:8-oxo-dGTP pyrophosphatase MutT (NUDIX family)
MDKISSKASQPALSATVLIVRDDPFEVLMVRRRAGSQFSSALVFPGGVVDEQDASEIWLPYLTGAGALSVEERALRVAACREAFEEAGVLLANTLDQGGGAAVCESFYEYLRAVEARIPADGFQRFGHWITPAQMPKRFDTHFFLYKAPPDLEAKCDGDEIVTVEWVQPADAVARAAAGERSILFPTLMNLRKLAESEDCDSALAAARARTIFTVMPTIERRPAGTMLVIPEAAGYGVTEYPAG